MRTLINNQALFRPDIGDPFVVELFLAVESLLVDMGYTDEVHHSSSRLHWNRFSWYIPHGFFIRYVDPEKEIVTFQRYLRAPIDVRLEYFDDYYNFVASAIRDAQQHGKSQLAIELRAGQNSR